MLILYNDLKKITIHFLKKYLKNILKYGKKLLFYIKMPKTVSAYKNNRINLLKRH